MIRTRLVIPAATVLFTTTVCFAAPHAGCRTGELVVGKLTKVEGAIFVPVDRHGQRLSLRPGQQLCEHDIIIASRARATIDRDGGDAFILDPNHRMQLDRQVQEPAQPAGQSAMGSVRVDLASGGNAQVRGDANIHSGQGNAITSVAIGQDTKATNEIGSIDNKKVLGDTTINASARDTAVSAGSNACASTSVGAHGESPCN